MVSIAIHNSHTQKLLKNSIKEFWDQKIWKYLAEMMNFENVISKMLRGNGCFIKSKYEDVKFWIFKTI